MGGLKFYICFVIYVTCVNSLKKYSNRPRIYVNYGHLKIVASPGKNIDFVAEGESSISINNINVLTTLNKAYNATKLTDSYQQTLSTYSDRLEALESRGLEPMVFSNFTNSTDPLVTRTAFRRLSRRVNTIQRRLNNIMTLILKDDCQSSPCKNGGTCQDLYGNYLCHCTPGWEGPDCALDINECTRIQGTDLGCQNGGLCVNTIGSYTCDCVNGFIGLHCTRKSVDCLTAGMELCGHGTCVAQNNDKGYKCLCDAGWTTPSNGLACTVDVNECQLPHPTCAAGVPCINVPGSFYCGSCPTGFTGDGYKCSDINECSVYNGGCSINPMTLCINTHGSRVCGPCPAGYSGDGVTCSYQGVCNVNNGGCNPLATCQDTSGIGTQCTCPTGYIGNGIGQNGCVPSSYPLHPCSPNPCLNGHCSVDQSNGSYRCDCFRQYTGKNCDTLAIDACTPNPCMNGGECQNVNNRLVCKCQRGYIGVFCQTQLQGCGGILRGDNGTLKYPSGDFETYNHRSNCAWSIILNSTEKVLNVNITKFDVEESPGCRKDWLEIHDGRSTAAHTLGRFCGNKIPLNGTFTSTHDTLYFWFRSDGGVAKAGFELTWTAITPTCHAFLPHATHGSIQSPGSPGNYPLNRDCVWTLGTLPNKRFMFHFFSLNIGDNADCNADYIKFYSSVDVTFAQFCNSSSPAPFYSPGFRTTIVFHSDNKDTYPGFQLTYSSVEGNPGCGGTFTAPEGIINSAFTDMMSVCEYKIEQPSGYKIKINFVKFDLEPMAGCTTNFVEIHEGDNDESLSVGKYCSTSLPAPFVSQGNKLTIVSSHYGSGPNNGWKIEYKNVCGSKYSDESGTFNETNSNDGLGSSCIYQIERPPGNIIMLIMKLNMPRFGMYLRVRRTVQYRPRINDCYGNYVEVRDGDHENATLIGKYCGSTTINITSTHNFLWIKVNLGPRIRPPYNNKPSASFEYTSMNVGCGGIFRAKMGNIASPTHPDGYYPPNLKCKWTIIAPPQDVIKLTWMTFYIEESSDCNYDNVQVFDNSTDLGTGALMGKYCGYTLPPTLLSSSNIITIVFSTDVTVNMDGFLASYITVPQKDVCGGNYFTPAGVLRSPKYPDPYPTNRECTWTINVKPGQQIMLNVTDFNIEFYSGCRYDWLEIRNGGTSASPLIGKFCGTTIPKSITSHANKLYVFFKSDLSRTGHGFRITWSSAATGCGGILTSPTGSLISPHYPEQYSRSTVCEWKIISSAGSRIQVVFSDINLEKNIQCQSDYVQIFDGSTLNSNSLGKFCDEAPEPVKSSGNEMLIKFRSDVAFQGRGFQLHYTTVCRNTVQGFRGIIESPNFPNDYPEDQDCLWEIVVSDRNKINITFSHFELERSLTFANNSCQFDYVEISYAKQPEDFEETREYVKYGRYCGDQNPGHISLNSDHVQIKFVSDKLLLGSGFRLEWELFGCGGLLKKKSGTIMSPNYPDNYPVSSVCEWRIEAPFGESIQLEFHDVDVEKDQSCGFDSVSVYNGIDSTYNLLSTICRQKENTVISSSGNFMFIKFKSDYSYHGRGFIANYTTIPTNCGGKMTADQGYIYSPNYPKNYNKNETCGWYIDVDEGHSVELLFEDVDLFRSDQCLQNYVKIHDGPSAAFPVLKKVCGDITPNETITSTYNNVYVEFRAHSLITTKGFKLKYYKSCGSKINTQSSGVIHVQHDEFSETLTSCSWVINSIDLSKHVTLTVSLIYGQYYCEEDNAPLKIYNGDSEDAPLIGQYCGPKIPPTMVSDGSSLTIKIQTEMTFFATYSVYDSQCGGTLISTEGYFSTPGYPKKYASDMECEWTIQIAPGNHVSLSFIDFNLLRSENCNTDYLEIRSSNASGKLLGVFCGNDAPENITHVGHLWLLYKGSKLGKGEESITAKGFYGEYILNTENELTGARGEIWSPLYPLSVMEYKTYTWKITVDNNKRVLLSFLEFYLDAKDQVDDECYFASFEVFDGVDDTADSLGKHCGLMTPAPIKSSSNIMFIKVDYSSPRLGSKFKVRWEQTDGTTIFPPGPIINTRCGNITTNIDLHEVHNFTLKSPGYPHGYEPNLKCSWTFSTNSMKHLALFLFDVDFAVFTNRFTVATNCEINDKITIYQKHFYDNDWQKVKTICKKDDATNPIHVTDLLKVEFTTTRFLNGTGFFLKVVEGCGGWLRDSTGYIIFNNSTIRGKECQWNITVRSTKTIELTFEEINIEHDPNKGCDNFLMIRNGKFADSPLLGSGKYCGSSLPGKLKSTGNNLYIKYKGTPSVKGFRIKYQEVSADCGGRIMLSSFDNFTEISSPNYPNIPNPHTECDWLITAPSGEALRIDFEDRFDLTDSPSCEVEYVDIRDGGSEFSNSIGRYCKTAPSSQFSSDNMMHVKFFTDTDDPKNGFKAKISIASCGGTIRGRNGQISYVGTSATKKNCTWNLVGPTDHYLTVTITKLDTKCTDDSYIILKETVIPEQGGFGSLGRHCGNKLPAPLISSKNRVIITSVMDNTGKFSLKFNTSQTQCGGTLTTTSGRIESPGYPLMNHFNRDCRWQIIVPEGRRISLKFTDLDLGTSVARFERGISLYDGPDFRVPLLSLLAPNTMNSIESSSNAMYIFFWSIAPSEHRGFVATYSSDLPSICEGDFSKENGILKTPPTKNNLYYCEWTHRRTDIDLGRTFTVSLTVESNTSKHYSPVCLNAPTYIQVSGPDKSVFGRTCTSTTHPVIIRSPFITTKLVALAVKSYNMNFTATYNSYDCGGMVFSQSGIIFSPNFPNKPAKGYECAWLLKVDEGQTINITTVSINLGDDCEKSFLTIYNGDLPSHPKIGQFCKQAKPEVLISQSNKVWIEYKFDPASTGTGFHIKYEAMSSGCGGIFHDKSRNIRSPNYGSGDYPNNAECLWIIESEPGYHIRLSFVDRFHLEQSSSCSNDFIEISHWIDDQWVSLGKKCGRDTPTALESQGERMKILFRSNDQITGRGFKAVWEWLCGGKFIASKTPRYIVSPGYPLMYKANLKCEYTITSKPNTVDAVNLKFIDFLLESGIPDCKFDNVTTVRQNFPGNYPLNSKNSYCGDKAPPPMRVRGNLLITFETDQSVNRRGFKLEFKDDSCGGEITKPTLIEREGARDAESSFQNFQPRIHCIWNITAPSNQVIVLMITKLDMYLNPSCFGQNVEIFNAQNQSRSNRLAILCGHLMEQYPIQSESGIMVVKLDGMAHSFLGFQAFVQFSHGPGEGCGGFINLTQTREIHSPNLPDLDCSWKIVAQRDYQIEIAITKLDILTYCGQRNSTNATCDCMFVEIRDGAGPLSEKIEMLCTTLTVPKLIIRTSTNNGYIRLFVRGQKNNALTFSLTPVMSVCGPTVLVATSERKTLESPNFGSGYPALTKCSYSISSAALFDKIMLHFDEFDLTNEVEDEDKSKCPGDFIQIYEDPNTNTVNGLGSDLVYNGATKQASLMYTDPKGRHIFCGKDEKPFDYYTSGKSVTLFLNSKGKLPKGKGFKLEYSLAGCNRNYTEEQGRINSGNAKTQCTFWLIVPENRTISVYFTSFYMYFTTNCTDGAMEIRDGSPTGTILAKVCGYRLPDPVFSTTNKLYFNAFNRRMGGFLMRYDMIYTSTEAGPGCGGDIYNNKGKIYSPLYPNTFRNDTTCTWSIKTTVSLHLVLKFSNFDIKGNCEQTFVEIETVIDGIRNTVTLCNDYTVGPIYRSESYINIKYTSSIHNGGSGWIAHFQAVAKEVTDIS